jgi:exosortase/archaeosortase family protein
MDNWHWSVVRCQWSVVIGRTIGDSLIHLPNGTVGIDEACSGIRSLQSTVMATLFIGHLTLKRFKLQVALFVAGILLAIISNVGRSLFLSLMANAHGVKSLDHYHDTAGWSILAFTTCGVTILAWALSKLESSLRTPRPDSIKPVS